MEKLKLATTTGDLEKCFSSIGECVSAVCGAGFEHLDFSFYTQTKKNSPLLSESWEKYADEAGNAASKRGANFIQAHSPDMNSFSEGEALQDGMTATLRSIEVCGRLGIPTLVVHAGWALGIGKEEYFIHNRDFFRKLLPAAERNSVKLCIENSAEGNMGDRYYFMDAPEMNEFIAFTDHPLIAACWDTGHANMRHMDQGKAIRELGSNLAAVHIQDNHGDTDDHIAPFQGTCDFEPIMSALADIGYNGAFALEAGNVLTDCGGWPHSRPGSMNPSPALRIKAEELLYHIGRELLDSRNM